MMTNRNYVLDVIRIIALLGVVCDHYLQSSGCNVLIDSGLCMGGGECGNFLFYFCLYLWSEVEEKCICTICTCAFYKK